MASKRDYARYCVALMEGDTSFIADLYEVLLEDGFVDEGGEWIDEEDE